MTARDIDPDELYSTCEVAEFLKVSEPTVRRWARDEEIEGRKIGRSYRIFGHAVLAKLPPMKSKPVSSARAKKHCGKQADAMQTAAA